MSIRKPPVQWADLRFLPDEHVWMVRSSTYQPFEVVVGGSQEAPDSNLLRLAKEIIGDRDRWVSLARDFLWGFVDRSKMQPPEEDWFADAFRFEEPGQFVIDFSHGSDPYGLWIVKLRRPCLGVYDAGYVVHEFRRRSE